MKYIKRRADGRKAQRRAMIGWRMYYPRRGNTRDQLLPPRDKRKIDEDD